MCSFKWSYRSPPQIMSTIEPCIVIIFWALTHSLLNTWLFGIHSQKPYLTTYHPNIDIRLTPKGQGGRFCPGSHRYRTTPAYTFTLQSSNFEHVNNRRFERTTLPRQNFLLCNPIHPKRCGSCLISLWIGLNYCKQIWKDVALESFQTKNSNVVYLAFPLHMLRVPSNMKRC